MQRSGPGEGYNEQWAISMRLQYQPPYVQGLLHREHVMVIGKC